MDAEAGNMLTICLLFFTVCCTAFLVTIVTLRFFRKKSQTLDTASVLIVVGSGGHTKEILILTEKLGAQYSPRQYVVASTDSISMKKILKSEENAVDTKYVVYSVPRSREVKQSWFTTFFTTLYASLYSLRLVVRLRPQIILCNGPGTCVPICCAGLLLKWLGLADTKIVYVESICRVETLSLSAKLLYPFSDSLIVQWPSLLEKYPKCQYIGRVL
ncbi:hypothetical protein ACOMHN_061455 [Nucella lapillus]